MKLLRITLLAEQLCREDNTGTQELLRKERQEVIEKYIASDGSCTIHRQTAVAMLIYYDIYETLAPLAEQLKQLVEEKNFHHDCGMVGIRRLYAALNKCGLEEYAYKIITAKGYPSYVDWMEGGATTLCERWNMTESQNHHMYSDFMSWMIKTILGIRARIEHPGFETVEINPRFLKDLTYAKGHCDTVRGRIGVAWERGGGQIKLTIEVPPASKVSYRGKPLGSGIHVIFLKTQD